MSQCKVALGRALYTSTAICYFLELRRIGQMFTFLSWILDGFEIENRLHMRLRNMIEDLLGQFVIMVLRKYIQYP